jgi:chemotaxis protein MotB
MRIMKISCVLVVGVCAVLANGCSSELQDLRIQNSFLQKRIAELESRTEADKLQLEQLKRQLATATAKGGIGEEALRGQIAALEEDLAKKNELIASMQQRLLSAGAPLPVEVSTKLEDFAKAHEMVTYDADRGIVRFKSDLLFEPGSDQVQASAVEAVRLLCVILNSQEAKQFDVIIAGHTDDMPIEKPATLAKHPTNWYLSVHRAISVLQIMEQNNVAAERLSARGFGQYRPIVPNQPNRKGHPQNRRVEIYIVPEGA